jgi:hypothetical protein
MRRLHPSATVSAVWRALSRFCTPGPLMSDEGEADKSSGWQSHPSDFEVARTGCAPEEFLCPRWSTIRPS